MATPKMTAERRAQIDLLKSLSEMVQSLTALIETLNEGLIVEMGLNEDEEEE